MTTRHTTTTFAIHQSGLAGDPVMPIRESRLTPTPTRRGGLTRRGLGVAALGAVALGTAAGIMSVSPRSSATKAPKGGETRITQPKTDVAYTVRPGDTEFGIASAAFPNQDPRIAQITVLKAAEKAIGETLPLGDLPVGTPLELPPNANRENLDHLEDQAE